MDSPFIGMIALFGFNFAPRGWAKCEGQLLPISQHDALFSLLGTTYGGDGRTTFALPDLRGRVAIGYGPGPGLTNHAQGARGGSESVSLTDTQLPAHTHSLRVSDTPGNSNVPAGNLLADSGRGINGYTDAPANAAMSPNAVESAGAGQPISIAPPYIALGYCIALDGLYPSRN